MAEVKIRMDEAAVHRMLQGPTGPVAYNMARRGKRVATRARQLAPGSMKRKISVSTESGHVRVECSHPAVLYVINGTRRHKIRPVPNRPNAHLKFRIGGKVVFARVVDHPGNKPNNFLLKALREASSF